MARTSSSIAMAVCSDTPLLFDTDLPKNTSPSSSSYDKGPSFSDKPHLVTMLRANFVDRSISFEAPAGTPSKPLIISSTIRQTHKELIIPPRARYDWLYLSTSAKYIVTPRARHRGIIDTL